LRAVALDGGDEIARQRVDDAGADASGRRPFVVPWLETAAGVETVKITSSALRFASCLSTGIPRNSTIVIGIPSA